MTATKKPAKKPASGVFDVSKPGTTGASATSRPIIIKHPTIQDPMVNNEPVADAPAPDRETAPVLTSPSAKKLVIQPLHESVAETSRVPEAPEEPKPEASTPAEVAPEEVKPEEPAAAPAPDSKPELAPKPAEETKPEPKPEVGTADQPVIDDEKQADERAAKIKQLVASEEYFLPIETIEQRRSKQAAILGALLIILLLVAWYDVALDAHLLSNTYKLPHTSFFSAK